MYVWECLRGRGGNGSGTAVADHGSLSAGFRGEVRHGDHSEGVVPQREGAKGL